MSRVTPMFQPVFSARLLFKSTVPLAASHTHPPTSLTPTTIPGSFRRPPLDVVAPVGNGIRVLPEVVPTKTRFERPTTTPTTSPEAFRSPAIDESHPVGRGIKVTVEPSQ